MTLHKKIICSFLILQLSCSSLFAAGNSQPEITLHELALPSETEGIRKEPGAVYFSSPAKGKVLVPVHIWGEVNKAGLHYLPSDTTLVKALSLAGGPKTSAQLTNIRLTQMVNDTPKEFTFNLSEGGGKDSFTRKLSPGDTIFVQKDYFYENRTYYTSLLGIVATVISAALIYQRVQSSR